MRKIIGTSVSEVDRYPLDCFSISHFNAGLVGYFISFWLMNFFFESLTALLIAYLCVILGGLFWEFLENICLVETKRNKREDSPINSLTDILLVFLGGILGAYTYNTDWVFKIILITALVIAYGITRILTEKNQKNKKSVQID